MCHEVSSATHFLVGRLPLSLAVLLLFFFFFALLLLLLFSLSLLSWQLYLSIITSRVKIYHRVSVHSVLPLSLLLLYPLTLLQLLTELTFSSSRSYLARYSALIICPFFA